MAVFPPIPLIRKKHIVSKLAQCGARSENTAKTLAEAGIINPEAFRRLTDHLVETHILEKTPDGKYYLA